MNKPYLPIINSKDNENKTISEFRECIGDLLILEDVQRLSNFSQHLNTDRLEHSVNVAYRCFLICKKLNWDYRSAARAGLLHDLFLYDWRKVKQPEGNHLSAHPRVALRTAIRNVKLNKIEQNAILRHMWPLTIIPPRYKEAMTVSFVDKYCCMQEVTEQLVYKLRNYSMVYRAIYSGGAFAK